MSRSKNKSKKGKKSVPVQNGDRNQPESANKPADNLLQATDTLNTTNGTSNAANGTSNAANGTPNAANGAPNAANETNDTSNDTRNNTKRTDSDVTCKACNVVKEGEWLVQCDDCDRYYHFKCVGYKPVHKSDPWSCRVCERNVLSLSTQVQDASKLKRIFPTKRGNAEQSQAERDSNQKVLTGSKRLPERMLTRREYADESARLCSEFMQRMEDLTTSYRGRSVSHGSTLWRSVNRLGVLDVSSSTPTKEVLDHPEDVKNEGENFGARLPNERPHDRKVSTV